MSIQSSFSQISSGNSRTVNVGFGSGNILSLANMQLAGSTSGTLNMTANAVTSNYSIVWPAAQAASSGYVLTNDGAGNLTWTAASATGVTSVSVVSANGFAGTVATATSTPAITISTTITGILKGNGTAISAATAGTDYVIPSGSITGTATNITATSNSTLTSLTNIISIAGNASNTMSIASGVGQDLTLQGKSGSINLISSVLDLGGQDIQSITNLTDASVPQSTVVSVDVNDRTLYASDGTTQMFVWSAPGTLDAMSNVIANVANGVAGSDAANYGQLLAVAAGLSWKDAVLVATTANITLSGEQTIDGFLTSSSRVLVKNQSAPANNGIYVSGSGAWTRAADMAAWSQVPSTVVVAEEGTENADLAFICTSAPGGTLGTTAITFGPFGTYLADGTTLALTGNTFSIATSGVGTTQLASNAVTYTKLQQVAASSLIGNAAGGVATATGITLGATLTFVSTALQTVAMTGDVTSSANSFATTIAAGAVTATKLGTVTDNITANQSGAGSTIQVLQAPVLSRVLVAGQTFAANTSYAVRWGITANSENANRVYAADITTTSFDLFYVIGMASSVAGVIAGGNISVTSFGSFALGSADTAIGAGTDGKAFFLTASGTISVTAPSTPGQAVTRIGIVRVGSATNTACILDVNPQTVGVN